MRLKIGGKSEAERDGNASPNYLAFTSFKQYLSLHDLSELDGLLPKNLDRTERYTPRIAITLFLAHLLHQASIAAGAAGVPWPVPIRMARPAWDRSRAKENGCRLCRSAFRPRVHWANKAGHRASGSVRSRSAVESRLPSIADANLQLRKRAVRANNGSL